MEEHNDMDSPITANQFVSLQSDVREIKNALKGSSYGDPGLVGRERGNRKNISTLADDVDSLKDDFNQFKTKITAYATVGAALGAAVIQIAAYFI